MKSRDPNDAALYQQMVESLPHMVWTCEGSGPCDYLSPQWVVYTGIPEQPQLGYGWLEQLHPARTKRSWPFRAKGEGFVRVAGEGA